MSRHQAQFLDSTAYIKGFVGGQGAGKTKIGAYDLLKRAKAGRHYGIFVPTYPMLRDSTFSTFREVAEQVGQWYDLQKTEFIAIIRAADGNGFAEVLCRSSGEPDKLRGPNLSGVWMDEASLVDREAFQIGVARLREAGEQGWLTATFTPKGRGHWTYEVFGKESPGVHLVQARTQDNPFVAEGFISQVESQYVGLRAAQELGGEFINVEGAEWPAEFFPASIWFSEFPADLRLRVIALDPSKGRPDHQGDYSAFVLAGLDRAGVIWVEADMDNVRDTSRIVRDGIQLYRRFKPDAFVTETNVFQELLAAELNRQARLLGMTLPGYGIVSTLPKVVRIRRLTPYLAQGRFRFRRTPGTEILVQQMQDFPEGEHDDGPDAMDLAMQMLTALVDGQEAVGAPQVLRV